MKKLLIAGLLCFSALALIGVMGTGIQMFMVLLIAIFIGMGIMVLLFGPDPTSSYDGPSGDDNRHVRNAKRRMKYKVNKGNKYKL